MEAMSTGQLAAIMAGLVLLNLIATILVVRLDLLTHRQKINQILVVWAFPAVGAVFSLVFSHVAARDIAKTESSFPAPGGNDGGGPDGPGFCETNFGCGNTSATCGDGE